MSERATPGLDTLGAAQTAQAVRSGRLSAREVTEAALERAAERGPDLGAFARLNPELALEEAERLDREIAKGGEATLGRRLLGVPCPIKDLNQVAGVGTSAGAALLAAEPMLAQVDDGVVTRLREAGTTMIGKTATPEFGFPPYTEPRVGPDGAVVAARTPWDLSRGAGGSSGGAAAAVAAGIVPIAHASDGGGSIRIPASCCGVVGFKPSRGVVSPGPWGVDGPALATGGAITRSVADAALALDVLASSWPGDLSAPPAIGGPGSYASWVDIAAAWQPGDRLPEALRGLRVGLLTDPVVATDTEVHPQARKAAERAARTLAACGIAIDPAPVPITPQDWMAFMPLWSVTALTLPVPQGAEEMLTPLTRWLREVGRTYSSADYAVALSQAQQVSRSIATAWRDFDVILTPTLAWAPPPVGGIRDDADPAKDFEDQKRFTPWTSLANLSGSPSVSLPVHRAAVDDVELPFGAMLTGRMGRDGELLLLSRVLEIADPWPVQPMGASAY